MGNSVYIVDYDIPRDPPSKRVQFYRNLKKVNGQCNFSIMSVIYTEEREVAAEAVYWLVTAYGGRVNMYKGKEICPV